jgi:hypothetical protein
VRLPSGLVHDDGSLRISQYAYFALKSETTLAESTTHHLDAWDATSARYVKMHAPLRGTR